MRSHVEVETLRNFYLKLTAKYEHIKYNQRSWRYILYTDFSRIRIIIIIIIIINCC